MSDKFEMSTGQAHEFAMACDRNGVSKELVKKMSTGDFLKTILPVLLGTGIVQIVKYLINLAGDPMPEAWKKAGGWKVHKHVVDNGVLELIPSMFKLYHSPNQLDGKSIKGEMLEAELVADKVPILNACVLDYLLLHPELIPEEWKTVGAIFFWGTIYRDPSGGLCVRCLYWGGGAWSWRCVWLDDDWNSQDPAASLA